MGACIISPDGEGEGRRKGGPGRGSSPCKSSLGILGSLSEPGELGQIDTSQPKASSVLAASLFTLYPMSLWLRPEEWPRAMWQEKFQPSKTKLVLFLDLASPSPHWHTKESSGRLRQQWKPTGAGVGNGQNLHPWPWLRTTSPLCVL